MVIVIQSFYYKQSPTVGLRSRLNWFLETLYKRIHALSVVMFDRFSSKMFWQNIYFRYSLNNIFGKSNSSVFALLLGVLPPQILSFGAESGALEKNYLISPPLD